MWQPRGQINGEDLVEKRRQHTVRILNGATVCSFQPLLNGKIIVVRRSFRIQGLRRAQSRYFYEKFSRGVNTARPSGIGNGYQIGKLAAFTPSADLQNVVMLRVLPLKRWANNASTGRRGSAGLPKRWCVRGWSPPAIERRWGNHPDVKICHRRWLWGTRVVRRPVCRGVLGACGL